MDNNDIDSAFQNRFRPPIPVASYIGTYNATSYGASCPVQSLSPIPFFGNPQSGSTPPSEDCACCHFYIYHFESLTPKYVGLTVDVIRPRGTKAGDKLPVVVVSLFLN
jgi:hypothetical protein